MFLFIHTQHLFHESETTLVDYLMILKLNEKLYPVYYMSISETEIEKIKSRYCYILVKKIYK